MHIGAASMFENNNEYDFLSLGKMKSELPASRYWRQLNSTESISCCKASRVIETYYQLAQHALLII